MGTKEEPHGGTVNSGKSFSGGKEGEALDTIERTKVEAEEPELSGE